MIVSAFTGLRDELVERTGGEEGGDGLMARAHVEVEGLRAGG